MLLNRWQNYVTSKDGGNAQLQGLSKEHMNRTEFVGDFFI
jgi:hypothetical protein